MVSSHGFNQKATKLLDIVLEGKSDTFKRQVYEIVYEYKVDPDDPMFLILVSTGRLEVMMTNFPQHLERLLREIKSSHESQFSRVKDLLETVGRLTVDQITQAGMAATSAIAEANSETLTQASLISMAIGDLTNTTAAFIDQLEEDRKTYKQDLQELVQEATKARDGLNQAIAQTERMHGAMDKLQNKIRLSTALGSIAPLTALGIAMAAGGVIWSLIMHFYWGAAEKYLPVIQQNQASFDKCFNQEGLVKSGLDCEVVYKKIKK